MIVGNQVPRDVHERTSHFFCPYYDNGSHIIEKGVVYQMAHNPFHIRDTIQLFRCNLNIEPYPQNFRACRPIFL